MHYHGRDIALAIMTKLTVGDFEYLAQCLEGFLFGELSVLYHQLQKQVQYQSISGVYTAIFAMYWHYHTSKDRTPRDNTTPITFYALCVLYVLSVAIFALDTAAEWFMAFVSNNRQFSQLLGENFYRAMTSF